MGCEQKCWLQPRSPTFQDGGRASPVPPPPSDQHAASVMEPGQLSPQEREGSTGSDTAAPGQSGQPASQRRLQGAGVGGGHFCAGADALSVSRPRGAPPAGRGGRGRGREAGRRSQPGKAGISGRSPGEPGLPPHPEGAPRYPRPRGLSTVSKAAPGGQARFCSGQRGGGRHSAQTVKVRCSLKGLPEPGQTGSGQAVAPLPRRRRDTKMQWQQGMMERHGKAP